MDNDPLEEQLVRSWQRKAPAELRRPVLTAVHRELAAQRWERWLGRTAAVLILSGIALNWFVGWRGGNSLPGRTQIAAKPEVIVEVAVAVAQATDAETGLRFAQHLATLSGTEMTEEQAAAMEKEIQRHAKNVAVGRKEG